MLPLLLSLFGLFTVSSVMMYGNRSYGNFPQTVRFDGSMLPSEVQKVHYRQLAVDLVENNKKEVGKVEESDCLQRKDIMGISSCASHEEISSDQNMVESGRGRGREREGIRPNHSESILRLTNRRKDGKKQETKAKIVRRDENDVETRLIGGKRIEISKKMSDAFILDLGCVSVWPDLCLFVDELTFPPALNGSSGEVLTIGAYKFLQKVHRDLEPSTWYGFGTSPLTATVPGPTIFAQRYVPTLIQWENHLRDNHYYTATKLPTARPTVSVLGGVPIVVHLHGGETEPPSDGHPEAWFTHKGEKGPTFIKSLYTYHNQQPSSTMWFHDHTAGLTALGIYHGMTGFYILTDPADEALGLPTGEFDLPMNIQNKVISQKGDLHVSDHQTVSNDNVIAVFSVNNVAWPYYHVKQAKYRLRFLNGCNLLLLNISFLYSTDIQNLENSQQNITIPQGYNMKFHQIASDGGYLNSPVEFEWMAVAPAERAEIIIDFTGYQGEVWMLSYDKLAQGVGDQALMKFHVGATVAESGVLPMKLNSIPDPEPSEAYRNRWIHIWEIAIDSANYTVPGIINGTLHLLDNRRYSDEATEILPLGKTEIWNVLNLTPQSHTIHLHAVKFRVLSRRAFNDSQYIEGRCSFHDSPNADHTKPSCYQEDVRLTSPGERGWKDTFLTTVIEVTKILVRTTNQDGDELPFDATAEPGYVWHCHMAEHEDYEMMRPLKFVKALESS